MEFKGTSGEWKVHQENNTTVIIAPRQGQGVYEVEVARCIQYRLATTDEDARKEHESNYTDEIISSNAQLIASSPELLEALQAFIKIEPLITYPEETKEEHWDEAMAVSGVLQQAKLAIKKALGNE